jgi:2'-hydroxyisoflavone reductase
MRILFLGGTQFVGRHMVERAMERGHEVTLFNRGKTNADLFQEAEKLIGDRDGGLERLRDRRWDAVIDVNGYLPRLVKDSAQLLAGAVERYVFISTISVFASYSQSDQVENAPLATMDDPTDEEITEDSYGGLKVLCERAAEEALPGRVLTIRPGYVVGPYDHTDRFTYWPWRINQGGEVLAPGEPETPLQFIDARDLAAFVIAAIEDKGTTIYNCCGPEYALNWGEFFGACKDTLGSEVAFTWVSEDFLSEQEVSDSELPMWPVTEVHGIMRTNNKRAISDGLAFRPMRETITDTLDWANTQSKPKVGLSPEREADLLRRWREGNWLGGIDS